MQAVIDYRVTLRPKTIYLSKHSPIAGKNNLIHVKCIIYHASEYEKQSNSLSNIKIHDIIL